MQDRWPVVPKDPARFPRPPVLVDWAAERASFTWDAAAAQLAGQPGGGLNIAVEAVERHAARTPDRVAVRWVGKDGATYGALQDRTSRVANALQALGLQPQDRVYLLLGRIPALVETVLGALKTRMVICPLCGAGTGRGSWRCGPTGSVRTRCSTPSCTATRLR